VLGWRGPGNKKALMGTIAHKVLEILARIKLAQQGMENDPLVIDNIIIKDEICGDIDIHKFDIHTITEQVYQYYISHNDFIWSSTDFTECKNSVLKVLNFNDGAFNPLKSYIVSPEQQFDIEFKEPWAMYDYNINGEKVSGFLSLKGTIDLIVQPDQNNPKILELIDYKTGKFYNWIKDEEKTEASLRTDPQLLMYHLAISYLYPEAEQVIVTIYYINNVGPITMCFTKDDIQLAKNMLKERFEEIKEVKSPQLNKTWKCSKLCNSGKTTFEGTNIKPMVEFRSGQRCSKGNIMTKCEQVLFECGKRGIDKVTKDYCAPDHKIDFYQNPGEI